MKRIPYDFFMGTELNPRSFDDKLDWKMFAELRISWVTLFLLTASAAAKQSRSRRDARCVFQHHRGRFLSAAATRLYFRERSCVFAPAVARLGRLVAILAAHWLYANACQKGEACVPYTWDVFHEKFGGWMLLWWNVAGVPFCYSACGFIVRRNRPAAFRRRALLLGGAPRRVLRLGRRAGAAGQSSAVPGLEGH